MRGAIRVLAIVLLAGSTADAESLLCRLIRCDDGDPCTVDVCRGQGICVFEPVRCDDGDACTVDQCDQTGTCRFTPGGCDDHNPCTTDTCSAGACVNTPLPDGERCPDDGFTCTDDTCSAGTCLHVPIDSRCIASGECASAACAPHMAGADVAGCLVGTPLSEGAECAEDGLPCTDDVCRNDDCTHTSVPNVETCEPVTKAFRVTLVLASQARATAASLLRLAPQTEPTSARALGKLAQAEAALHDTADALAGKTPVATTQPAGGFAPTVGQLRAIDAADRMAGVPAQVRDAIRALRRLAPAADPELLASTIERARALRRGIRRLKLELKRLRRVQQTFAL